MKNSNLHQAKKAKNDEFYTQLVDIEKELNHYQKHFKNKVVYCNCDNYLKSSFFTYFTENFNNLGLRKLICSSYEKDSEQTVYVEYKGNIEINHLNGDGDFRSEECVELLKQADIVVSNPPFSLFREYVSQLIEYNKKFVIIGNINAITYKEIFKLIKENKLWLGCSIHSGDREFGVPDSYPLNASSNRIDIEGNKFIRVKGVRWFTNLNYNERYMDLISTKYYTPKEYPKYDNYDAINVDKTKEIPMDYTGNIGVPITFMDKYNPEQFEIVGITDRANSSGLKIKKYTKEDSLNFNDLNAGGVLKINNNYKSIYVRIIIKQIKY